MEEEDRSKIIPIEKLYQKLTTLKPQNNVRNYIVPSNQPNRPFWPIYRKEGQGGKDSIRKVKKISLPGKSNIRRPNLFCEGSRGTSSDKSYPKYGVSDTRARHGNGVDYKNQEFGRNSKNNFDRNMRSSSGSSSSSNNNAEYSRNYLGGGSSHRNNTNNNFQLSNRGKRLSQNSGLQSNNNGPKVDTGPRMSCCPRTDTGPKMSYGPKVDTGPGMSCCPRADTGPKMSYGPKVDIGPRMSYGPRADTGPKMSYGPRTDTGPKMSYGPRTDTGPKMSYGPRVDTGPNVNEYKGRKRSAQVDYDDIDYVYMVPKQRKIAEATVSRRPDSPVATPALKPKNEEVTSPMESPMEANELIDDKPFEPVPGPSSGRNISQIVMNRIKADKKFQANVKTLATLDIKNFNKPLVKDEEKVVGEEMDWEHSDQEVMIEHIKSIRKNLDTENTLSCNFALQANNFFNGLTDNVLIVLDTNVFISCLPFVKEIRDTYLPDIGLPSIFIPWIVLRELDHLKVSSAEQLAKSAVRAIRYINETFSSNHPRVNGQSFEEYRLMKNYACECSDDEILNICITLKACNKERKIILITNDKNLENKALVSGVQAYSKQRFANDIMNKSKSFENGSNSKNPIALKYTLYPKLKILVKIALELIVESELKKAFGDDWLLIVIRKPPWNLINVLECLIKHWRSVFTFVFDKNLFANIHEVRKRFIEEDKENGPNFLEVVQMSEQFLQSVRRQISSKISSSPEYLKMAEHLTIALHEIELLRQVERKLSEEPVPDVQMANNSVPIEFEDIPIEEPPVFNEELCKEEVKALFQIIWNQVQSYYLRINELVVHNGVGDKDVIEQIKYQFPQVIQKLQELIQNLEKIVSLEPLELAQSGHLIVEFTNFLVSLNLLQAESINMEILLKNIEFFCCNVESRTVLHALINDLKHFGIQIVEGATYLGYI